MDVAWEFSCNITTPAVLPEERNFSCQRLILSFDDDCAPGNGVIHVAKGIFHGRLPFLLPLNPDRNIPSKTYVVQP